MKYSNSEMKIDTIVSYLNEGKIVLIPPFQRGSVWKLPIRRKLLSNIVMARPIPAIFLYREASGSKFDYNILDGKQRLESLMLFVGNQRKDMRIPRVLDHFYRNPAARSLNFKIDIGGRKVAFGDLDDERMRAFREYAIPTVVIDLDDEASGIDEVISLFIDINIYGVKVHRFDVVKAIGRDPLFNQAFKLVAIKEKRKKAKIYKPLKNSFVFVLKRLAVVSRLPDANSRVDRMWERLTEIALFAASGKHRPPGMILKSFIKPDQLNDVLTKTQLTHLRSVFGFLKTLYQRNGFKESKLATDQPQFYTLVTTLLSTDKVAALGQEESIRRLQVFRRTIEGPQTAGPEWAKEWFDLSTKQTTNSGRRDRRQHILLEHGLDLALRDS